MLKACLLLPRANPSSTLSHGYVTVLWPIYLPSSSQSFLNSVTRLRHCSLAYLLALLEPILPQLCHTATSLFFGLFTCPPRANPSSTLSHGYVTVLWPIYLPSSSQSFLNSVTRLRHCSLAYLLALLEPILPQLCHTATSLFFGLFSCPPRANPTSTLSHGYVTVLWPIYLPSSSQSYFNSVTRLRHCSLAYLLALLEPILPQLCHTATSLFFGLFTCPPRANPSSTLSHGYVTVLWPIFLPSSSQSYLNSVTRLRHCSLAYFLALLEPILPQLCHTATSLFFGLFTCPPS